MVPNPIYEGPQYEIIQPELNILITSHQTEDAVESLDNQAVPTNEVAQSLETAISEASEPSQGSGEGSRPFAVRTL